MGKWHSITVLASHDEGNVNKVTGRDMSRYFTVCFNCQDRKLGCHKNCEKYLAERKAYDDMREKKRKHEKIYSILSWMHKKR